MIKLIELDVGSAVRSHGRLDVGGLIQLSKHAEKSLGIGLLPNIDQGLSILDAGVVSDTKVHPQLAVASQLAFQVYLGAEGSLLQCEVIVSDYLLGQGDALTRENEELR